MSDLQNNISKELFFLGTLSIFCFTCSIFRCYYSDTYTYLFLNWNLFLAAIPWIVSKTILRTSGIRENRYLVFGFLMIWLLFFPNAPYILTDLFHLNFKSGIPIWFDLVLILSFAWTGLLFGFLSLLDLEKLFKANFSRRWMTLFTVMLLFVSSFGVYLGRFLRWNSWDILTDPLLIINDVVERFVSPFDHPRTWGMTILLGVFLNIVYFSMKMFHYTKQEVVN